METLNNKPAPRTPLNLEVSYKKSYCREQAQGKLMNISLTGAFIEFGEYRVYPQDKIQVELVVADRVRKIQAKVVWANEKGCGVQFQHSNGRDWQIVDDLIYYVEESKNDRQDVFGTILKKVG